MAPASNCPLPGTPYDRPRYTDAEPLLLDAFHGRETKLGQEHPHTLDSLRELVRLYESWSKPDEAAKWRARPEAAAISDK